MKECITLASRGSCSAVERRKCTSTVSWMFLHRECQLKWLLLSPFHNFLPELSLVLHTLELRLNVLLRDLQQTEDTVISLLGNHVQNVAEALRTPLPPSLVNSEGHILGAFLPS